ncbi:MAG TPA: hypothetical protein PLH65_01590 [bacterium]|nr:hypothetical protein [bacterium]HPN67697.1 hypothetical protein [bacterium]
MKNNWITGGVIVFVYALAIGVLTYYQAFPSQTERQAQKVSATLINSSPVSDEVATKLKARQQYGDLPIEVSQDRVGKYNPFRK